MVLIDILAYAADYLSYDQDAVATEAYLGTSRRPSRLADTRAFSIISCTTAAMRGRS